MKTRGIGFFEQNIEKLVLGGVGLAFLGVVAMQFLYEPNKIKIGNDAPVAPGEAYRKIEEKARQLNASIDRAGLPEGLPQPPSATPIKEFEARRNEPLVPRATIAALGRAPSIARVDPVNSQSDTSGSGTFAEFKSPAPAKPVAFAYGVTVDPTEVALSQDLAKILPAQQPYDTFAVSVEATFDGTALGARLAADPDGDGPLQAMPSGWYRNGFEVMGVRLQRQERNSDGSWGDVVDVPAIPGKLDMVQTAQQATDFVQLNSLITQAKGYSEYLMRQPFLSTIAGDAWAPPNEASKILAVLSGDMPKDIELKFKNRMELATKAARLKAQIGQIGKEPARPNAVPGSGGGGRGSGGREVTPAPANPNEKPDLTPDEARKKTLETELKKAQDAERKVIEELIALKYLDKSALPAATTSTPIGDSSRGTPGLSTLTKPTIEDPSIRVWAHDLTATPGKTYRYRVLIATSNPLFGKGTQLSSDQQKLATQQIAFGEPSEWTPPIGVLDKRYTFVTGASDGSTAASRVTASFDVYEFHYGFYRKGLAQLEAGDPLEAQVTLNDPNRRPIFDLKKLVTETGEIVPIVYPEPEPAPEGQPDAKPIIKLPENSIAGPKDLKVASPLYLLDVTRVASVSEQDGRSGESTLVTLVNEQGALVKQVASKIAAGDLAKRLALSVKLGESQGDLQTIKGPMDAPKVVIPKAPRPNESPDAGGGGGGGGG